MTIALHIGDCRAVLATLPAASVHCVVTSPPYWGLRDYGTATWEGGDPGCDHLASAAFVNPRNTLGPNGFLPASNAANRMHQRQFREQCGHCGAIRIDAQIGLEPDFNAYVANMVAVFREVRRVLRDDGTLWLNLGDSYNAKPSGARYDNAAGFRNGAVYSSSESKQTWINGLKPKDLCGIPWRVAFALQADGWYLRQDIIWSKPNPMPESVTDRCTKAHEYLFLLSKRPTYYYDAEAIKEPVNGNQHPGRKDGRIPQPRGGGVDTGGACPSMPCGLVTERNKRSVWEVTTAPFSEAHFATFPPALIEPCIKAGCPIGGTVLDPFGGAGTTGLVADRLQRNAILIELNPAYAAMSENRIKDDAPLFAEVAQP